MDDVTVSTPATTTHRLDISRDSELLQRFVRINLDNEEDDGSAGSGGKAEPPGKLVKPEIVIQEVATGEKEEKPAKPAPTAPEHRKAKDGVQMIEKEVDKKGLRKRRRSRIRHEEVYTDKDRAAAVAAGSRDIKQSLKLKRKQDRSKALAIPEEAEPATFLALGNYEMGRGDLPIALDFMTKALELNPTEKNALVARSKCYLLLGQPENGLQDAETALAIDKGFIKAIYQKAESLYYLGDFEHSLMYYHRGLRLRPEHEGFKLGIQKAQKAIENAIGGGFPGSGRSSNVSKSSTRCSTKQNAGTTSNKTLSTTGISGTSPETVDNKSDKTIKTTTVTTTGGKRRQPQRKSKLLRELGADKEFLDNLLNNPDINCKVKEDNHQIMDSIKNAVDFLNKRQEFWRQQLPPSLK